MAVLLANKNPFGKKHQSATHMQNDDNSILCLSCGSVGRKKILCFIARFFGAEAVGEQRKNCISSKGNAIGTIAHSNKIKYVIAGCSCAVPPRHCLTLGEGIFVIVSLIIGVVFVCLDVKYNITQDYTKLR